MSCTWPRVVLLGDSITQYSFQPHGWGARLQDLATRKCDVINRGFSGYNTKMILHKFAQIINEDLMKNVVAVTLFLGANDAALPEEKPAQHVPLDEYEKNLGKLIEKISCFGVTANQIIVITPPPVHEPSLLQDIISKGEGGKCTRTNENAEKYAKICMKVAEENGCRGVNVWKAMTEQRDVDVSAFLSDGLHLSDAGNNFLADLLDPHINELTEALPYVLPYWRDFKYDE